LLAHGGLTREARDVVSTAMESLHLSARGFHRVLRIGRTIADLDESETIDGPHAAEALRYRPRTTESGLASGPTWGRSA
jgi:predicted ATPase with chaperone activity